MAMAVLPVWRSPRINSRWPRPMGMSASMTLRPVWSGTVTGARSMMAAAGRSIGRRSLAATGPLPSSGRPSGSMTRPSNPSPTATSMTRPVRSTSSPACRCQYSPSSTTPISSSSTLNAMPNTPPGNSAAPQSRRRGGRETLAMPVEMLVIVPTSCGLSCGVNVSRTWLIPQTCGRRHSASSQAQCSLALCFGLWFLRLGAALLRLGLGLGFGLARPWPQA